MAAAAEIPLTMLSKATVRIGGIWEVIVWQPFEDKYEYDWKGKKRQGTNFICTLVYAADPRQYCQAQFKKNVQNEKKYDEALKKIRLEHASRCQKLLSSRMPKLRT